jgi:hypothetical protein
VTATTLTTSSPVARGHWLELDGEQLKVILCTGHGPFTLTVRPVTRWDYWLVQLRGLRFRLRGWWEETRCLPDHGWCWRRATADYLCDRHWLRAVEDGADGL